MGCLRAEKIIDYLSDPLAAGLQDENPYVRKTAALCVAKMYDLKPSLAIDRGFVDTLKDLVGDPNPTVSKKSYIFFSFINYFYFLGRCKCCYCSYRYSQFTTQ